MVERMRTSALTTLVLLAAAAGSHAQALVDPTRPPNAPALSAEGTEAPAGNQLQSVLISAGRRIAVINGETVSVGGRVGDATVVKINPTEVTLRRGNELETIGMFSGIEIKGVRRRAAEKGQRK
jgi:MSHA biogenesis protein MshK